MPAISLMARNSAKETENQWLDLGAVANETYQASRIMNSKSRLLNCGLDVAAVSSCTYFMYDHQSSMTTSSKNICMANVHHASTASVAAPVAVGSATGIVSA